MKLRLLSRCVKSIPPSSLITRLILILVTPRISQASGERHPALHLPPLLACWITFWLPRYPEAQARAGTCLPHGDYGWWYDHLLHHWDVSGQLWRKRNAGLLLDRRWCDPLRCGAERRYTGDDDIRLSGFHYDAVASLAKYLEEGTEPWGSSVGAAPFFTPGP